VPAIGLKYLMKTVVKKFVIFLVHFASTFVLL
jgi:hypothetical protein